MGISLSTNISALNAAKNLNATQSRLSSSLEKLTSGSRINSAADDAAGLTISQSLATQISGTAQAASNTQDAINVVSTADGALSNVQSILQRMRDLAVQGANDTLSTDARSAIQTEADQLGEELNRTVANTNFNGIQLLDGTAGTAGTLTFQVGAGATTSDTISVTLSNLGTTLGTLAGATGATGFSVTSNATAQTTITSIDTALAAVGTQRSTLGATENRLTDAASYLSVAQENLTAAKSTITDTDMATEMVNYTSASVLSQAGSALLSQANQSTQSILKLFS